MSPVAPMPCGAAVGTNGLKSWVIVLSGELSMTRVPEAPELEEPPPPPLVAPEPHALSPAASSPAAATTVSRR